MNDRIENFLIGLGAALIVPIGTALVTVSNGAIDSPGPWLRVLVTGCAVAAGKYLLDMYRANGGAK